MAGMNYEEMKAELARRLKPGRFRHSLGVADTAAFLARRFGVDEEKARLAGLLHDCAREFPNDSMIAEAEKRGIEVELLERSMPLLLHAYIGGSQMTPLDKIIWYADMIEPSRDYPEVEHLRQLAREASLDEMVLTGLSESIIFVVQKGHLVHPATVQARNEILLARSASQGMG